MLSVVAGIFSALSEAARYATMSAVVAGLAIGELNALPFRPGTGRSHLVPRSRFSWSLGRGAFLFGIELGVGGMTAIPHIGPYVAAAFVVASQPGLAESLVLLGGWSLGRSVVIPAQVSVGRIAPHTGKRIERPTIEVLLGRAGLVAGVASAAVAILAIWL